MKTIQRQVSRGPAFITLLILCVLLDVFTPFSVGGAFHLQAVNDAVEMTAPAPPVTEQTPTVEGLRVVNTVARIVPVVLPDGPVSARTPAARPPPSL